MIQTSAKRFYGGRWLSAKNFGDSRVTGQITEIGPRMSKDDDGEPRERLEIVVEGIGKPVLLNAGNTSALDDAFGDDYTDWVGKLVTVCVEPRVFEGKATLGISVKPAV